MSYTGFVQGSETTLQSTYSDSSSQPTCDYGYGNWNSGSNRGYDSYGYGYGYSQDNSSGYGMNQRAEMVPHMDADMMQGGMYGSGGERYDSYEACDSRAGVGERDRWAGYDYGGDLDPDVEMAYEGQYGYRDQFRVRGGGGGGSDGFGPRAQTWAREARGGRAAPSDYPRVWEDPMGPRGQCLPGASRLPSLFSQNIIPEYGVFQGVRGGGAFSAGSRFSFGFGNGMKQLRPTWKTWTKTDFRIKRKKRKQPSNPEEPETKATRTDGSDNSDSDNGEADNDEGTEGEATEGTEGAEATEKGSRPDDDEEGKEEGKEDAEKGAQDESATSKRKLLAARKSQEKQKRRQRDRMVER